MNSNVTPSGPRNGLVRLAYSGGALLLLLTLWNIRQILFAGADDINVKTVALGVFSTVCFRLAMKEQDNRLLWAKDVSSIVSSGQGNSFREKLNRMPDLGRLNRSVFIVGLVIAAASLSIHFIPGSSGEGMAAALLVLAIAVLGLHSVLEFLSWEREYVRTAASTQALHVVRNHRYLLKDLEISGRAQLTLSPGRVIRSRTVTADVAVALSDPRGYAVITARTAKGGEGKDIKLVANMGDVFRSENPPANGPKVFFPAATVKDDGTLDDPRDIVVICTSDPAMSHLPLW